MGTCGYRRRVGFLLLAVVLLVPLGSEARNPKARVDIAVNPGIRYQEILGFGGFLPMLPWWRSWDRYSQEAKNRLFDTIFEDLGVTVVRLPFPAGCEIENDNQDPFSIDLNRFDVTRWIERDGQPGKYDGEVNVDLYVLAEARKRGIQRFIMSSYSVAPWLKDSRSLNGGRIVPGLYDEFAETIAGTLLAYKKKLGLDIYAVSLFNEPDYVGPYATTKASPATVSELVKRTKQRLVSEGLNTLVGAPEDSQPGLYKDGVPWISEAALPFLDAYVFHQYGGFFSPFSSVFDGLADLARLGSERGIPIIQNEISNHNVTSKADTREEGLYAAMHVYQALVKGNVQIWNWWLLYDVTPPGQTRRAGQRLIYFNEENGELWISPKAFALRQYFKFIPVGSRRVEVSSSSQVLVSAFIDPSNEITIVAINNQPDPQPIALTIDGNAYGELQKVEFSEQHLSEPVGNITITGSRFEDTLAPLSVTTFTSAPDNNPPAADRTPPVPPSGLRVRP